MKEKVIERDRETTISYICAESECNTEQWLALLVPVVDIHTLRESPVEHLPVLPQGAHHEGLPAVEHVGRIVSLFAVTALGGVGRGAGERGHVEDAAVRAMERE